MYSYHAAVFIDYSGKKPQTCSPDTDEVIEVELFVAVLGASNYTFAEAIWNATCPRARRDVNFCEVEAT